MIVYKDADQPHCILMNAVFHEKAHALFQRCFHPQNMFSISMKMISEQCYYTEETDIPLHQNQKKKSFTQIFQIGL